MKTAATDVDPADFIASVANVGRREDAEVLCAMMARVTGLAPRMWGDSIIGYGRYDYTRADGSEHSFFRTGFSPRKANMSIYLMPGVARYAPLLKKLGKHKHSVSCLYVGRLSGVDMGMLENIVRGAFEDMNAMYPQ